MSILISTSERCRSQGPSTGFNSLEHEVLRVSFCDHAVSVVRRPSSTFYLVYAIVATFSVMKLYQHVCLNDILDKFENVSCHVKNCH